MRTVIITVICFILIAGCHPSMDKKDALFQVLDHAQTGLDFNNKLTPTREFNVFKYMYYYDGGGVGAGDFNNDGRIDLFFAANQTDNKLYLNEGSLHFKDVSAEAKIPQDGGWSTGVSVIDINNDGLLDIYICRVGNYETLHSHNQLLVCQGIDKNGIPSYKDEAAAYGLDFSGFSTQALFVDYDMDGDLDMYLLNHLPHQNGNYYPRNEMLAQTSPLSGDRLYRNDGNGHFTDVTKASGINSSLLGFGLGVEASDIDLDGYPDIYIDNDFHENDYLYINQHNGTFKDELSSHIMHTSKFAMGLDIADATNDGFPEIISLDMLPFDPLQLKSAEGENTYDIYKAKLSLGYYYQYNRNNLQYNRRNGNFSETGLYSGIAATDWSWSPLFLDFDNDGSKDLFISNGTPRRMNDIDFINYISNEELQQRMRTESGDKEDVDLIQRSPQIKIASKFFHNDGDLRFSDQATRIGDAKPAYSNGAIYADLDNDGDLDVVVNNIDDPALLYANTANDKKDKPFVEIKLKGPAQNINALGAKIVLFANGGIRTYEKYPVRGFQSSSETPIHVGLYKTTIDSAYLVWPDNTCQPIRLDPANPWPAFTYQKGLPKFDYTRITGYHKNTTRPMQDITASTNLLYKHTENEFAEFDRDPLLPHMLSTEGPAMAIGDVDGNGTDDVFLGAARNGKSTLWLQNTSGKFTRVAQPGLDNDSSFEDVDACIADINKDGKPDLVVASGGNEFYGPDPHLTPRVYLGDGKGHFTKKNDAFDTLFVNASCVVPYDFNGDGYTDLFIGGRSVPNDYGQVPRSYLLQNDGTGHFTDVTPKYAPDLAHAGFVTRAIWFDLDKDGQKDLIVSLEWGGILAFLDRKGSFTKKTLTARKGWWNFILPVDVDNNGNTSLIAGNLGLNSKLHASESQPVRLYCYDFDNNGKKDKVITYYIGGEELPFAPLEDLQQQMPGIRKKYPTAAEFAKASLSDIFSASGLKNADTLSADYFSSAILLPDTVNAPAATHPPGTKHLADNTGYNLRALPWEAQLSPYRDAVVVNANDDSLPDILLVGNYWDNNVQLGRNDADFGTILVNHGHGSFTAQTINGLAIKGQVRRISPIRIAGKEAFILARNNDSTMIIRFGTPVTR